MIGALVRSEDTAWVPPVDFVLEMSSDTSPAEIYADTTWLKLKDRLLFAAGDTFSVGSTGGAVNTSLAVSQLPSHSHTGSTSKNGGHTHTIQAVIRGEGEGRVKESANCKGDTVAVTTSAAGAHGHTGTLGSVGSGQSFSILNSYYAVNMWRRIG